MKVVGLLFGMVLGSQSALACVDFTGSYKKNDGEEVIEVTQFECEKVIVANRNAMGKMLMTEFKNIPMRKQDPHKIEAFEHDALIYNYVHDIDDAQYILNGYIVKLPSGNLQSQDYFRVNYKDSTQSDASVTEWVKIK